MKCPTCGEEAIESFCGEKFKENGRTYVMQRYQCRQYHSVEVKKDVTALWSGRQVEDMITDEADGKLLTSAQYHKIKDHYEDR